MTMSAQEYLDRHARERQADAAHQRGLERVALAAGILAVVGVLVIVAGYAARRAQTTNATVVEDAMPPEERTPQASVKDVTTFATAFLGQLGYHMLGQVDCDRWEWDGWHKQYTCYAAIDPAWPPLALHCGPRTTAGVQPLGCTFIQQ